MSPSIALKSTTLRHNWQVGSLFYNLWGKMPIYEVRENDFTHEDCSQTAYTRGG